MLKPYIAQDQSDYLDLLELQRPHRPFVLQLRPRELEQPELRAETG